MTLKQLRTKIETMLEDVEEQREMVYNTTLTDDIEIGLIRGEILAYQNVLEIIDEAQKETK